MILVTGGTGFIGSALISLLVSKGFLVRSAVRRSQSSYSQLLQTHQIPGLTPSQDWTQALLGVDHVVHCAARVHVMQDTCASPMDLYRDVNVLSTLNLARQAARAGVRRFLFISSIKVNGESTYPDHPFTVDDLPLPSDPYAISKLEAEEGLRSIEATTGMEVVIIRPPLVYGPNVKANFERMLHLVRLGIPLPFAALNNSRSLVSLYNLIDLLMICLNHPNAAGRTFLVSDGMDVSTSELVRKISFAMHRRTLQFPIPPSLILLGATLLGNPQVGHRLCGSLQVDITQTRSLLSWSPPLTLDQGIDLAVNAALH